MRTLSPGDAIGDRFTIERIAGEGGMGTVFRAVDRGSGAPVAVKVIRQGADGTRFLREAEILSGVPHAGIVRYVAHGVDDGLAYLAMEWLEGEDLEQRLAREGLSIHESMTIGLRVAQALGAAHERGVVHRDIKPSNLFLVNRDVDRVKVLDFGAAQLGAARQVTRTGVIVGTPGYLSPEQARGGHALDARTDVFSLGCVLFECITGRPAFVGEHAIALLAQIILEEAPRASTLRRGIRRDLDDLVARMLAKDPDARPRDGASVASELAALAKATGDDVPAGIAPRRPSLTISEQRVLSVLLVRGAPRAPHEPESPFAATVVSTRTPAWIDSVAAVADAHDAKLHALADGSLLVTLSGSAAATDTATRAARCALALRQIVPEPIALATGRGAVSGRIAVGDVVSNAARLVASPSAHVRVDEVTAGLLDARFEIRGDDAGLEIVREREQVDMTRTLLGKPTPCVGREREIGTLLAMFEECAAEPVARCVLVTGTAGIGKSRIRHEVLARLAGRCEVWRVSGDTVGRGAPFGLVAPPIRHAAGIQSGEPLDVARRKLAARVARNVTRDRERVTTFLAELLGIGGGDAPQSPELATARTDGIVMGDQIRRAWQELAFAETTMAPLVLVLEDLHLGDLASVKLVDLALRNLRERPFMVLAFARPEVAEVFPDLWRDRGLQRIELGELTRRASEKLVRAVLGDVDEARMARIVERAAGNAFYLEETLRAEATGKGDALPATVLTMVQSRLEGLHPDLRRVLRAASIFGRLFWANGVAALLEGQDFQPAMLARLEEHELVARLGEGAVASNDEYAFRHSAFREAAYATLTDADRALGHRLAAEWLERSGVHDATTLADHHERAGELARAVPWYARAAQQALEGNDFVTTIERAGRGIACGAEGTELGMLHLFSAEAHRCRGEFEETSIAADAARSLLERGGQHWCQAHVIWAGAMSAMGRLDRAQQAGREALDLAFTADPDVQLGVYARIAGQATSAGDYPLARRLCAAAEEVYARGTKSFAARAWIERSRSVITALDGDTAATAAAHAAAAHAAELAGDLRYACTERHNAGDLLKELGDYAGACSALESTLADAERLGLTFLTAAARNNLAFALFRGGHPSEALALARRAIDDAETMGFRRFECFGRLYLAMMLLEGGQAAAALDEAKRAVDALVVVGPPIEPFARALVAKTLLALGRREEALDAARGAYERLIALGAVEEGEAVIRVAYVEALDAMGEHELAREIAKTAHARLLDRASKIRDEATRHRFLEKVPEHARTTELASRA